jgi:hydrogenase/urease accessory protein HupE
MKCNGPALLMVVLVLGLHATCAGRADAHGVDPIGVAIAEQGAGAVHVRIDRPLSMAGAELGVEIGGCVEAARRRELTRARAVDEVELQCDRALSGRGLTVTGLAPTGLDAVLRAELQDGSVHRTVVTAATPDVSLPSAPSRLATLFAYLALGAEHLLFGFDHLLFVLGTLLLERRPRRAALALTGFTVGHSLTLCAAVLGLLRVPAAWAEVGIALSLLWLAIAVVRSDGEKREAASLPRVAGLAFAIGLVHGLGFADVLSQAGIPARDLPLALFGFNMGIELVQLGLVVAALVLVAPLVRARRFSPGRVWVAHAIGALAVMWCIERVLAV